MGTDPIRVLIVEDSSLFVEVLSEVIARAADIEVVGVATDGRQGVEMTRDLRPDLVTMDLQLPVVDGLDAVSEIMAHTPVPILVVSGTTDGPDGRRAFEALRRGALEVMEKPNLDDLEAADPAVIRRIRSLAKVRVIRHPSRLSGRPRRSSRPRRLDVVGIVASTGGPPALAQVLGSLSPTAAFSVLVVQHLAPGFAPSLADWLDRQCDWPVAVASDGIVLEPGTVWLAPDGRHMGVSADGRRIRLHEGADTGHRPSGDELLRSLVPLGRRAAGIVLTGMGRDGSRGLQALQAAGGWTLVQEPESAVIGSMPRAARPYANQVVGLDTIASVLG